jgi:hypothetical protein
MDHDTTPHSTKQIKDRSTLVEPGSRNGMLLTEVVRTHGTAFYLRLKFFFLSLAVFSRVTDPSLGFGSDQTSQQKSQTAMNHRVEKR